MADEPISIAGSEAVAIIAKSDTEAQVRLADGSIATVPADRPEFERVTSEGLPAEKVVPASVSPRQLRLALLAAGLLDQVEQAVKAVGDRPTAISWEYSLIYERSDPMIAAIAKAMSKTDADVDDLFRAAAAL